MSEFYEDIFDKQPFGFPKGYNTQQCLLKMLEIWKSSVDKGRAFSALLTDLSRAFILIMSSSQQNVMHMVLVCLLLNLFMILCPIENKEPELKSLIVFAFTLLQCLQSQCYYHFLYNIFNADLFFLLNDVDIVNFVNENTPCIFAKILIS